MSRSAFSIQNCLAIMITVGFFAIIGVWMFYPPKGDGASIAVLNTLTGIMGSAFTGMVGYFFGSSSGSKEKDETIKAMKTGTGNGTTDTTVTTTRAVPAATVETPTPPSAPSG